MHRFKLVVISQSIRVFVMLLRSVFLVISVFCCLSPIFSEQVERGNFGYLEIRLAEAEPSESLTEMDIVGTSEKIFVHRTVLLSSRDVAQASLAADGLGHVAIAINLTDDGATKLSQVTERHQGKRLAIIVDDRVLSAPKIVARIEKQALITGDFTEEEAKRIVAAINSHEKTSDLSSSPSTMVPRFVDLFNGKNLSGWVNVNTEPETWQVKDGLLVCSGQPIGVMRSEKQYENFILHIEWRHMKPGGNSGVFVWSEGFVPEGRRLPKGMEVQMLELQWVHLHRKKNGLPQDIGYISGELFGAGGLTATPDHPRGRRSMAWDLRCNGAGSWNVYDVVCVDGTVKLSINGKFVNSIRDSAMRKGYLCLESEGSEIHFRNIRILELPPGSTTAQQTARLIQ